MFVEVVLLAPGKTYMYTSPFKLVCTCKFWIRHYFVELNPRGEGPVYIFEEDDDHVRRFQPPEQ